MYVYVSKTAYLKATNPHVVEISLKFLVAVKEVKQKHAPSGPGRISWFIIITEFYSPRILILDQCLRNIWLER